MYPIILAHGIVRFDVLRELLLNKLGVPQEKRKDNLHYFRGIKTYLKANGFDVYHSNVNFGGNVSLRAKDLSKNINKVLKKTGCEKVHIIAHSMGGLDARHMIVDYNMETKLRPSQPSALLIWARPSPTGESDMAANLLYMDLNL